MAETIATFITDLTAAGIDAALILRIVAVHEEIQWLRARVIELEGLRDGQRRRQKDYRKRLRVTSPLHNAQLSFLLPLNSKTSSPLKQGSKEVVNGETYVDAAREGFVGNRRVDMSRGHALPEGWQPDIEQYEYGLQIGLSRSEIDAAAEDMRLWAGANRNRAIARKADWNLTFKGWLRRVAGKRTQRNASGGSAFDVSRDLDTLIEEGGIPDEPITRGAGAIRHR